MRNKGKIEMNQTFNQINYMLEKMFSVYILHTELLVLKFTCLLDYYLVMRQE